MSRLLTCKDEVHNEEHRVRFYLGRVNEERREALRKKIEVRCVTIISLRTFPVYTLAHSVSDNP